VGQQLPESAARLLTIATPTASGWLVLTISRHCETRVRHVVFNLDKVAVRPLVQHAIEENLGFAESYGVFVRLDAASADPDVTPIPTALPRSSPTCFRMRSSSLRPAERCGSQWRRMQTVSVLPFAIMASVSLMTSNRTSSEIRPGRRYQQRQKGGTGLGLSIVSRL